MTVSTAIWLSGFFWGAFTVVWAIHFRGLLRWLYPSKPANDRTQENKPPTLRVVEATQEDK